MRRRRARAAARDGDLQTICYCLLPDVETASPSSSSLLSTLSSCASYSDWESVSRWTNLFSLRAYWQFANRPFRGWLKIVQNLNFQSSIKFIDPSSLSFFTKVRPTRVRGCCFSAALLKEGNYPGVNMSKKTPKHLGHQYKLSAFQKIGRKRVINGFFECRSIEHHVFCAMHFFPKCK